jgi:hypothetical protein
MNFEFYILEMEYVFYRLLKAGSATALPDIAGELTLR